MASTPKVELTDRKPDPSPLPAVSRVEPQLKELMGIARAAMHLPGWHQRSRARGGGIYQSTLRGRGMEYDESRPYQAGDDIRTLDWRVTARSGKPHTKLFREERERPVYLCVDMSRTMRFATRGAFKTVVAARAAALLAWKAQQSGDRIGGIVFDDHSHHELEPLRGKPAVIRLLKAIVAAGAIATASHDNTNEVPAHRSTAPLPQLDATLMRLRRLAKPGSLIFLLSDFRQLSENGESALARLAQHCDTMALCISDVLETAAPTIEGRGLVSDGRDSIALNLGNKAANQRYHEAYLAREARLKSLCKSNRVRLEQLMTDDEPLVVLERLLR